MLDSWLPPVDVEITAESTLKYLAETVNAELRTYTHPVEVEALDDGTLKVSAKHEAPVRRVADADDPANIRRTRAALRQAVGWPEALAANARVLFAGTGHRMVDSWAKYENTRAGVLYTVSAQVQPDLEAVSSRTGADKFRSLLAQVIASMRSPFNVETTPGAERMVRGFVTVHGPTKVAKIRKQGRRVIVAHPDRPGETFEAKAWNHNGENRFRINLDGKSVKVGEAGGWYAVDLDRPGAVEAAEA